MVAPAELVDAIAAERWAVDRWPGDLGARVRPPARDRRGRPPPAPHPARVSRPPRRLAARLAERLPDCRVEGDSGGLHLLLRLPAGTDEDAVVSALERRRIRIRASPATG
jgi:GntR family transcriptional regulator/MocR family aminotransferase